MVTSVNPDALYARTRVEEKSSLDREALSAALDAASSVDVGLADYREIMIERALLAYVSSVKTRGAFPELQKGVVLNVPGYEPLAGVLREAFGQSAEGKGKERHAGGKPFLQQPIMNIGRMGDIGMSGHAYQVAKKAQEATTMVRNARHGAARAELLGAIIYAAAAILTIDEM